MIEEIQFSEYFEILMILGTKLTVIYNFKFSMTKLMIHPF